MVRLLGLNFIGLKRMALAKKKSNSNRFSDKHKRITKRSHPRFAVCIRGTGFDLIAQRVYRVLADRKATRHGLLRVIDESGEDYLYPASCFVFVKPDRNSENRLAAALRNSLLSA